MLIVSPPSSLEGRRNEKLKTRVPRARNVFSPHEEEGFRERVAEECVYQGEMGFGEGVASIEEWMVAAMNAQLSKLSFQDLQVDVEGREGVAPSGRGERRARGSRAISIGQNVG